MTGYTTRDVASLLNMPEHRVRQYARSGLIEPERGPDNQYIFSFQDLVLLRTAAELTRAEVPPHRIIETLGRLKSLLPADRPLSGLRIHADGHDVVVQEHDEPPWNPKSGQFHIEFDVDEPTARIERLERTDREHVVHDERSAADWIEMALELEASDPERARHAYEQAVALEPELAAARVNLGRLLHEAGLSAEAESQYRHVLSQQEHPLAAYNLGVLLEDLGRSTEAIQAYARALAADPTLAEAHYNLGRLYEARGDRLSAIRHFNGYRALVQPT